MQKQAMTRFLKNLKPRQLAFLLAAVVLFGALLFVLERTGVMDDLLGTAGVTGNDLPAEDRLVTHFIDVGNADATLLTCGGKTLLIDAGEKTAGDTVVAYLKQQGVTKLDYVIATHADTDHIGGMRQVVESFPVGKCLLSYMPEGAEPTTSTYRNLLKALKDRQVPIVDVRPGEEYPLGEATVTILGPIADTDDKNEQSVVCRVTHGQNRLLFTGDAGAVAEKTMLNAGVDLSADLLKVGHHGSNSSSTAKFLAAVKADMAVIPCGADNEYGHPHREVRQRLREAGVTVYRTDQHGTVRVTSDGEQLTVYTEKKGGGS